MDKIIETITQNLIAIITTSTIVLIAILKNETLQNSIINFFASKLNKQIIDKKDLESHEIFIKLRSLLNAELNITDFIIPEKTQLFNEYCKIIGEVNYKTIITLIKSDYKNKTITELRNTFHKTYLNMFLEMDKNLNTLLLSKNNDTKKLLFVTTKLKNWKKEYQEVMIENILSVFSISKNFNNEYILDKVLVINSICIDFLILNNIESFKKLNGELDSFLINNKK